MQSIPIGPTGAATSKPIKKPVVRKLKLINAIFQFVKIHAHKDAFKHQNYQKSIKLYYNSCQTNFPIFSELYFRNLMFETALFLYGFRDGTQALKIYFYPSKIYFYK